MIVTEEFVYIHLPKTGGTFVETVLQRLYGSSGAPYLDTSTEEGRRRLGVRDQHQTVAEIPAEARQRPVLFTVRNPFDHAVSLFEFAWWKDHPGDTFDEERIRRRHPHYPDLSFAEYLPASYDWDLLTAEYREISGPLREAGVGPLTWEYLRFLAERPHEVLADLAGFLAERRYLAAFPGVRFLRMEDLNAGLVRFLVSMGWPPADVAFVLGMGRVYPTADRRRADPDWRRRYSPELERLVRTRERVLFEMFPDYDPARGGASQR